MGCRKLSYYEQEGVGVSLKILRGGLEKKGIAEKKRLKNYLFGFNGMEMDNEVKGEGNSLNFKYRMYDVRIARFFAVDPLTAKYPYWTPYQFAGLMSIRYVELEGLEHG